MIENASEAGRGLSLDLSIISFLPRREKPLLAGNITVFCELQS